VPRVPNFWLDSIVYLYPSEADAWVGTGFGGTGFIVGVPREDERVPVHIGHLYFVANDQVRRDTGAVRFNLHDGSFDVKAVKPEEWSPHPDGDDVAVRDIVQHEAHKYSCVNLSMLLTPDVQAERDFDQESILVEARSLSGFSGSPVYVTRTATIEPVEDRGVPAVVASAERPVYLLGIDWGHHPWQEPVMKEGSPIKDLYIDSNSGMMMVVPAAKLMSLLAEHPDLIEKRRKAERELVAKLKPGARLDSPKPPESDEFENFERLTRKLAQTPKPQREK
jgi:hypothetical protein